MGTANAKPLRRKNPETRLRREFTREPGHRATYTATEAKNDFGKLLEQAIHGEPVIITRHGAEKAVMISAAEFRAFRREAEEKLQALRADFDRMYAEMQAPEFHCKMTKAFHMSPKELGKAAVRMAKGRG